MDITVYESNDTTFQLTFQLTSHEVSSSRKQLVARMRVTRVVWKIA